VFTDPPYAEEFLYLAESLGVESFRLLIPGSSLFIIAPNRGESYEYYFNTIRKCGFKFQHYITIVHAGGIDMLHDNLILVYQKPLLWFYKPDIEGKMTIYRAIKNIIYSDAPDKDEKQEFEWLQRTKEVKHALNAVTVPGMKVLDPTIGMGEGTTGKGALELGLCIKRNWVFFCHTYTDRWCCIVNSVTIPSNSAYNRGHHMDVVFA
jgi:hypothetical protein